MLKKFLRAVLDVKPIRIYSKEYVCPKNRPVAPSCKSNYSINEVLDAIHRRMSGSLNDELEYSDKDRMDTLLAPLIGYAFSSEGYSKLIEDIRVKKLWNNCVYASMGGHDDATMRDFLRGLFTIPEYFMEAATLMGFMSKEAEPYLSANAMVYLNIINRKMDDIAIMDYDLHEALKFVLNEIEIELCHKQTEETEEEQETA